jgi:hypothetical protein
LDSDLAAKTSEEMKTAAKVQREVTGDGVESVADE